MGAKIGELIQEGIAHHSAGRLGEAEATYINVLSQDPKNADALHLLGLVRHQRGNSNGAIELIGKAIELSAGNANYFNSLGEAYRGARRVGEAEGAYREAIRLEANHPEAHCNLGLIEAGRNDYNSAMGHFMAAARARPGFAEPHSQMGTVLLNRGRAAEAIAEFEVALKLKPNHLKAWYRRSMALYALGRYDEAIEGYQRHLALSPSDAEAMFDLGVVYERVKHADLAMGCWERVLQIDPGSVKTMINLAELRCQEDRRDEAEKFLRRAIEVEPGSIGALNNLAQILAETGRGDEAMVYYEKVLSSQPPPEVHSNILLTLHYLEGRGEEEIFESHLEWARQHEKPVEGMRRAHGNDPSPDRRLRIGYVSNDFRRHSVNYFAEPFLSRHDHERFEVFCYADELWPDAVTERFRPYADRWLDIKAMDHDRVAEQIRADGIDVLIDLAGHTARNRLPVFARKPAPVQATYLGYVDTTGMGSMDYRLTDALADPAGMTERWYTEKLVRLPRCAWCYRPPEPCPDVVQGPASEAGAVTFGSFNVLVKMGPRVVEVWARILNELPKSKLLLKNRMFADVSARQRTHEAFEKHGVAGERVELMSYAKSYTDHLNLYGRLDIVLDPFPYHGTTTTCEALWMGVPVISLAGMAHVSRVGVSLLSNVGLEELVAKTGDEYVAIAADLARDLPRLRELRGGMRRRLESSPLRDEVGFTADMEGAYRTMWREWCGAQGGKR